MSFAGNNPKSITYRFVPQSADPASPSEGDIHYSDGTARLEGLWVYMNGAWTQISTAGAISVLDNLTLTPQSADPLTPDLGMLFVSDGTSRTAGLWLYTSAGWSQLSGKRYQEFTLRKPIIVKVSTTTNVIVSNLVVGAVVDGVTLASADIILVRAQTTTSENGIYVVAPSGAPTRHPDYDSAVELNGANAWTQRGAIANQRTRWFQTATLTSLSDPQTWALTPATQTFTVPAGVFELETEMVAAGGGGGGGGGANSGVVVSSGSGGGGGAGALLEKRIIPVVPNEVITLTIGVGGNGGLRGQAVVVQPGAGANGTNSIVSPASTSPSWTLAGAQGGARGTNAAVGSQPGGLGATALTKTLTGTLASPGGNGGAGVSTTQGTDGAASRTSFNGGTAGVNANSGNGRGGGGGGGASGFGQGSNGVNGFTTGFATGFSNQDFDLTIGYGAGGGGGGGAGVGTAGVYDGGDGKNGGDGYIKLSWK